VIKISKRKNMETAVLKKKRVKPAQKIVCERFFVDIPKSDKVFFKHFAEKMGWHLNSDDDTERSGETLIEELKTAILEAKEMEKDIRKNGTKGYQTMDEFLKTV
jgi:hypothetical protein